MKALALAVALLITPVIEQPLAAIAGELVVEPNDENVVSSRIEGDWVLNESLTHQLLSAEDQERLSSFPAGVWSFQNQPNIVEQVPDKAVDWINEENASIYMAGSARIGEQEAIFLLSEINGNPHILFFLERGGDPTGNAESVNVMLAPGSETSNDILLIGGDFNNQPFIAFQRAATNEN